MKFVLKGNQREIMTTLPNTESEISRICKGLNVINDVYATVTIGSVMDPKMNHLLQEKVVKLEELSLFMKLFDSLGEKNKDTFYAVADGMNYETLREFINLTFNTHCYSLVDDFKDLNRLGKDLYLNEKVAATLEEMSAVDGIQYVRELMSQDRKPIPSIYGYVYPNKNVPEEIYQGQVYPEYHYNDSPISVCLQAETNRDFLYLPCTNEEVLKAVQRLGQTHKEFIQVEIIDEQLPDSLSVLVVREGVTLEEVNQLAMHLKEAGKEEYPYLEKLFRYTKVKTVGEFNQILEDAFEFDLYTAKTPIEYAREIICESGCFNYDSNLDSYIDFERYGRDKMDQENGLFTTEGYLVYHGENQEILNLLQETIGLKNDKEMENQRKDDWEL